MPQNAQEQLEEVNRQIKELVGIYRDAVSHSHISENEYWLWYALTVMGGTYTQQELCGLWSLSKQTVNSIISNMVKADYVRLEAIVGTRNQKRIVLTEKGRERGLSIVSPVTAAETETLKKMPADALAACTEALEMYTRILKQELKKTEK